MSAMGLSGTGAGITGAAPTAGGSLFTLANVGKALSAGSTVYSATQADDAMAQPEAPPPADFGVQQTTPSYRSEYPASVNIYQRDLMAEYLSGSL